MGLGERRRRRGAEDRGGGQRGAQSAAYLQEGRECAALLVPDRLPTGYCRATTGHLQRPVRSRPGGSLQMTGCCSAISGGQTVRNEKCCAFSTFLKVCGALSAALTASTVFGSTPSPPFSEPHSCTGTVMPARASAVKKTEGGSATTAALIRRSCVNGSLGYSCARI